MTRFLLVPGRGTPTPRHWQQLWATTQSGFQWAPEPPGPPVVLDERVAALHRVIGESDEPAVLVAHSAGCIVTAVWAARHTGPVKAALLVAPPHVPELEVPRNPLPFQAIVVASRTDPWCTYEESERYARDWGAELYDAGDAGHIETASGYGPWPEGLKLAGQLDR